jgi:hypothetical protein
MPSYEELNFRLRPAKNIERKMIADLLQKVEHIKPLDKYQYVGFGSTFFSEFRLFHCRLGIDQMVSIEQVYQDEDRFEFNKPFDCIEVKIGKSKDALPTLDWNQPKILWLDYESPLKNYMLKDDLQQFFTEAPAGSVIFITLNVGDYDTSDKKIDKLKNEVGADNIPVSVTEADLFGWEKVNAYRKIILQNVEREYIRPRNTGLPDDKKLKFKQLVNFAYADDARMMTFGGILHSESQSSKVDNAAFDELEFVVTGEDYYKIRTPNLTFQEMRYLDEALPGSPLSNDVPVDDDEKEKYAKVYRYYPRFTESEL